MDDGLDALLRRHNGLATASPGMPANLASLFTILGGRADQHRAYAEANLYRHVISGRVPTPEGMKETYSVNGPMHKSGNPLSRRLKVVCGGCNGGWMSVLQSNAKPFLAPMLTGAWHELSHQAKWEIARWALMFSIIYERSDPERASIDRETRVRFMHGGIPEPLMVWIGRNRPTLRAQSRTHHRAWGTHDHGFFAQATIASPGDLTLVTFSMRWDLQHPLQNMAILDVGDRMGLTRIWPPIETSDSADPLHARKLDERAALGLMEQFAKTFEARSGDVATLWNSGHGH